MKMLTWGTGMSLQRFMAIHLEIVKSGPQWWICRTAKGLNRIRWWDILWRTQSISHAYSCLCNIRSNMYFMGTYSTLRHQAHLISSMHTAQT